MSIKTGNVSAALSALASPKWLAASLESGFRQSTAKGGLMVVASEKGLRLLQELCAFAPSQVVVFASIEALLGALETWEGMPPCPISLVSSLPEGGALDRLHALGLAGWWPDAGLPVWVLAAGLSHDRIRWQREAALRQELRRLGERLDARQWLDRAKGILAQARGLDEDAAFKLLRSTAMHSNLTMGRISRSVVEASIWADALNRAGQLRMLSQRIVKLTAQRFAGVDTHRATKLREESEQRVQAIYDYLSRLPQLRSQGEPLPSSLEATKAAWSALKSSLAQRSSASGLMLADRCADRLLKYSETLVGELETASQRHVLGIVNLCGRQRMLVQRMTKDAWLTHLTGEETERHAIDLPKADFEAALIELDRTPLTSPEIRNVLRAARVEWSRLQHGLRSLKTREGRLVTSRASEALLETFDGLTASYGRSMQVIMS
jgi:hypothetical protein